MAAGSARPMSAIRWGNNCIPAGQEIRFGIELLGVTPEPTHNCPGGWSMPGLIGGWSCPCECHRGVKN